MQQLEDGSFYDPSLIPSKSPGEKLEKGVRCHDFIAKSIDERSYRLGDLISKKSGSLSTAMRAARCAPCISTKSSNA